MTKNKTIDETIKSKTIDDTIDDSVEKFLKQENPQAEAVRHLVKVEKRKEGEQGTDVELKTDLTEQQILDHAKVAFMGNVINMPSEKFAKADLMGDFLDIIERKSISKDRKSRAEIVAVARNPDTNITEGNMKSSWLGKFFSPKPKQ